MIEDVEIIQINTDGIMIAIDDSQEPDVDEINRQWCEDFSLNLEADKIKAIYQKDVNNYLAVGLGGKLHGKGDFIKIGLAENPLGYDKNDFYIVSKALVDYFVHGIPVETTIRNEKDILKFQQICHASSKYSDVRHNNQSLQKTNRVYASKDESNGTIMKKSKKTGRWNKFANCPEHCVVDNENKLTIDDIDVDWYIKLAKKRLKMFTEKEKK